ncbi:VanZ like protein [Idiomarina fontislapidosi]|uniref:VanZ family protein n=1 Tax=Idiomarina fontislapidosi TaxID=263723 RepID=UPI000D87999E|nr:VanZ family protein [Idiomarina fontislapidosi]PYE33866.1 VanZ like protein [Idiomarina fontislapidosi]
MSNLSASRVIARAIFLSLLVAITFAFLWQVPSHEASRMLPHADKWVHFTAFFLLSFTLHKAFDLSGKVAIALLLIYGCAIEVIQYYIPGRGSDVMDWLADAAGVVAYFSLLWIFRKRRH